MMLSKKRPEQVGFLEKNKDTTDKEEVHRVQGKICTYEAACQRRNDRPCGSWEDDADGGIDQADG
jgi:hypothetical protein